MPKLWSYHPEPITKVERIAMLPLVAFIDLFPLLGIGWGLLEFFLNPYDNVMIGTLLIILSIIFISIMIYFSKILLGHACQKCPNFSCAMNKVSSDIISAFLNQNPLMKKAWEEAGWTLE
ncbi:MAG: hypothetical protein JSW11_11670 [Candidatus Heimdallarchaeota archaeon]|nr:MAG: hypothetical protein JSW11_11670 [Candidatus Heimdallarchaeota archaeon]